MPRLALDRAACGTPGSTGSMISRSDGSAGCSMGWRRPTGCARSTCRSANRNTPHRRSWRRTWPPTPRAGTSTRPPAVRPPSARPLQPGSSVRFELPGGTVDPDRHVQPLAGTKEGIYLLPQLVVGENGPGKAFRTAAEPGLLDLCGCRRDGGCRSRSISTPPRRAAFFPTSTRWTGIRSPAAPFCSSARRPTRKVWWRTCRTLPSSFGWRGEHDFLLVSDECYCELYNGDPPPSALQAALADDGTMRNVVVMHSLSKRSNAAGLRSGFCAGDPEVIRRFLRLRAYGAAVQPLPLMAAATALWGEEAHVENNRKRYRRKFDLAEQSLAGRFSFYRPEGGFFLWLDMAGVFPSGEAAALALWRERAIKNLAGQLSRRARRVRLQSRQHLPAAGLGSRGGDGRGSPGASGPGPSLRRTHEERNGKPGWRHRPYPPTRKYHRSCEPRPCGFWGSCSSFAACSRPCPCGAFRPATRPGHCPPVPPSPIPPGLPEPCWPTSFSKCWASRPGCRRWPLRLGGCACSSIGRCAGRGCPSPPCHWRFWPLPQHSPR